MLTGVFQDIEKLGFDLYAGQVELQNPSNTQLFYWYGTLLELVVSRCFALVSRILL